MTVAVDTTPARTGSETGTTPAVELSGVTKSFGDSVAVAQLDLQLAHGEFFALLGPSGCGKTTTLRMVGGFELPTTGRVLLDGKDVTTLPPYKRNVNTVFQSYALFPHLTVFDNVAFGLSRKHLGSAKTKSTVEHHLEMVGLAGYGKRRPGQLSGGQQQRVALARALINEPEVLLLDEPMGALDAKIRKSMQLELKRIQQEVGITFLYVTHDQAEAMSMADRLAVMHDGLIEDIGAPERVYDAPATEFVANFLGTCNILPVSASGKSLTLPDGSVVEIAKDASVPAGSSIGLRPEKLVISKKAPTASSSNTVMGTVSAATYLGASTDYDITTSWGTTLRAQAQNLEDGRARPGDTVTVTWNAAHCFVLPPASGSAA